MTVQIVAGVVAVVSCAVAVYCFTVAAVGAVIERRGDGRRGYLRFDHPEARKAIGRDLW